MLESFLKNDVIANLAFFLVLVMGAISYANMPRQEFPDINMNWVEIVAVVPGAGATDVEKLVTDILEEGIRNVRDIRWVQSTSRDGTASISIRFNEMNEREFDKRVADVRREVQAKQRELPADVDDPFIIEITSSSRFPSVSVALSAEADSELLRRQGEAVLNDLEKIQGVD